MHTYQVEEFMKHSAAILIAKKTQVLSQYLLKKYDS